MRRHHKYFVRRALVIAGTAALAPGCDTAVSPTAPTHALVQISDAATARVGGPPPGASNGASRASTIRIIQGSIVADQDGPVFDLKGTKGFRFEGGAIADGTVTSTFFEQCAGVGCPAGATVRFFNSWSGNDFGADAVLQGEVYEEVGGLVAESSAIIVLSGALAFPAAGPQTAVVTTGFELSGTFFLPEEQYPLTGDGIATFYLEWSSVDQGWYVTRVEFRFTPAPGR